MGRLVLGCGHDPQFAGASGEVEWVRSIKEACKKYFDFDLVPDGLGGGDATDNLLRKIKWVNDRYDANDVYLALHENSGGGTGNEVWYYGGSNSSMEMGNRIANRLAEATGLRNRGAKPDTSNRWGRLAEVRDTDPWAFLLELGFADSPGGQDEAKGPDAFARGIALAVRDLGFPVRNLDAPAPQPNPTPPAPPAPNPGGGTLITPSEFYKIYSPEGKQIIALRNNPVERINGLEATVNSMVEEAKKKDAALEAEKNRSQQLEAALHECEGNPSGKPLDMHSTADLLAEIAKRIDK